MPAVSRFHFRDDWRALKRGRPGHRFQDRYAAAHRAGPRSGMWQRILTFVIAALLLAIAAVLSVIPGPAFPFFILAGALLATQSKTIARWMDALEVRTRKVFAWVKRRWHRR